MITAADDPKIRRSGPDLAPARTIYAHRTVKEIIDAKKPGNEGLRGTSEYNLRSSDLAYTTLRRSAPPRARVKRTAYLRRRGAISAEGISSKKSATARVLLARAKRTEEMDEPPSDADSILVPPCIHYG